MKRVWKYKFVADSYKDKLYPIEIDMPINAEVLSVGVQNEEACLWALVDDEEKRREKRTFFSVGTGHGKAPKSCQFIGTLMFANGAFVLHIFAAPAEPMKSLVVFE